MQKKDFLVKKEMQILEKAIKHIKKTYKERFTSIASVLLTKKGNIYTGINLKYKNIWKCICAEKVAIAKASEDNNLDFDIIVSVKYEPKNNSFFVINMCGECRQIAIFHRSLKVISDDKGILKSVPIKKLLPMSYG